MRSILVAASLIALAACSRGGSSSENFGVASGNTLNQAEIDAALGPMNEQQPSVNSTIAGNQTAAENGGATKERTGNEAGLLRRHRAGNAAQ